MATLRPYWKSTAVMAAILAVSTIIILIYRPPPEALAQESGDSAAAQVAAVDPYIYEQIMLLRQGLSLRNADLAALGCPQEQAESVLAALVQWHGQNQLILQQAEASERRALQQLQEAVRKINVGPRDEMLLAQLPALQQQHATAQAFHQQAVEGAVPVLAPLFSAAQNSLWSTARANAAYPSRYRYAAGISKEQVRQLEVAAYKQRLESSEQTVLSAQQKNSVAQASANQRQFMAAVLAAENSVLPDPRQEAPDAEQVGN